MTRRERTRRTSVLSAVALSIITILGVAHAPLHDASVRKSVVETSCP